MELALVPLVTGNTIRLAPWVPWWEDRIGSYVGLISVPKDKVILRDKGRLVRMAKPQAGGAPVGERVTDESADAFVASLGKIRTNAPAAQDDMLFLAAGRSSAWANPGQNGQARSVPISLTNGGVRMVFALAEPGREWLFGAGSVRDILVSASEVILPQYGHSVLVAAAAADLALGLPAVSDQDRRVVMAQLAFLGYKLAAPDILNVERGFGALPNMIARKEAANGIVGALFPSHPMARQWTERADKVLRRQIKAWSDENGSWLEALGYQSVSMDVYFFYGLAARNAGLSDLVDAPRLRKAILFMANEKFTYAVKDMLFEGTAGVIQERDRCVRLTLGASGRIRYKDNVLESGKPAEK